MDIKPIIVLPDYILGTLKSRNIDFTKFSSEVDNIFRKLECPEKRAKAFELYLGNHISKYDVNEILYANRMFKQELDIDTGIISLTNNIDLDEYAGFINNYKSEHVDMESIMLSSIRNTNQEVPYQIMVSEEVVFVILQKGFNNFKNLDIVKFKAYFLEILISYMFKLCGEQTVYSSTLFRKFVSLLCYNTKR